MNQEAIDNLRYLVFKNGLQVCFSGSICVGLINKACEEFPEDRALFAKAYYQKVPQRLLGFNEKAGHRDFVAKLTKELVELEKMTPAEASWAVNAWTTALAFFKKEEAHATKERSSDGGGAAKDTKPKAIVDSQGKGQYTTIQDALAKAPHGTRILVNPGEYSGPITIKRPVEIFGQGALSQIRIIAQGQAALQIAVPQGASKLQGLSFISSPASAEITPSKSGEGCVEVTEGDVIFDGCAFDSARECALSACGEKVRVLFEKCFFSKWKTQAVLIADKAAAWITDLQFEGFDKTPIVCAGQSSMELKNIKFQKGIGPAIVFSPKTRGILHECSFRDLTGSGILLLEDSEPIIEKSSFQGIQGSAILSDGGGGIVRECNLIENTIGVLAKQKAKTVFEACNIHFNTEFGIHVQSESEIQVINSQLRENKIYGVLAETSAKPHFSDTGMNGNKSAGICFSSESGGLFERCQFHGNERAGIIISDHASPVLKSCTIENNKAHGASIYKEGNGTFDSCQFSNNAWAAVEITNGASPLFTQCRFTNGNSAVSVQDGGKGTFENCTMNYLKWPAVVLTSHSMPLFKNCHIERNKQQAIFCHADGGGLFDGCSIESNSTDHVRIRASKGLVLRNCKIADGHAAAILLENGAFAEIENCEIEKNILQGILVKHGASVHVKNGKIKSGKTEGVNLETGTSAEFEGCEITENKGSGIVMTSAKASLKNCLIQKNAEVAVSAYENSSIEASQCDLTGNSYGAWSISDDVKVVSQDNKE